MRPFRFGVEVAETPARAGWRAMCREVADLGYATLLVIDHMDNHLAPVPAMMAAADAAPTLRVGSFVMAEGLRHPALLAREIATVDRLTDGRVELGIGAGWRRSDYDRLGVDFPGAADRVRRLAEALTIIKGVLGGHHVDWEGRYYTVRGLPGGPAPSQWPRPPILVGGGGRRVLGLAAEHADIVGLNLRHTPTAGVMADATHAATRRKLDWIRRRAGDRYDRLEINLRVYRVVRTGDWRTAATRLASETGLSAPEVLASPHLLVGDTDRLVDQLVRYRAEFGISYLVVTGDVFRRFAPVVARLAGS